MDKKSFVLAALSPAGAAPFSPVQVQKLFFLLDRNVADHIGEAPYYQFQPYDYGPFDKQVYRDLEELEAEGLIEIHAPPLGPRTYRLTEEGLENGKQSLAALEDDIQSYLGNLVAFVRSRSFTELVSTIYHHYPEMKVNSVFVSA